MRSFTRTNPGGEFPSPAPVPTTIRLRQGGYIAALANRPLNHDWPENIQHLWYAAQAARSAVIELEMASRRDPFGSGHPAELAQYAYDTWQRIEQYAASLVAVAEVQRG